MEEFGLNNNIIISNIFKSFKEDLKNKDFYIDKNNVKMLEKIGFSFCLNPKQWKINTDFKSSNISYIKKELKWYLSQSLSINGYVDDIKIWKYTANKHGEINSNYGYLVFSEDNGSQFENAYKSLINDRYTRQAVIIYTRPEIHTEAFESDKKDFICTNLNHFFIRNNRLIMIYQMRSNDFIYGFFNDFAWACFLYRKMFRKLKKTYKDLEYGYIQWNADSLHIYERHFDIFKNI